MTEYHLTKPCTGESDVEEIADTLESMWLIGGPKVSEFEERIEEFIGCEHAAAVTSCTAGIHASLLGLGIGEGDEVIVPAFAFPADATMVLLAGAKPVFVDVDYDSHMLDPEKVEDAVTEDTEAIVCVDYCGLPTNLDELKTIADRHDLEIIQDAATSFGATYNGEPVGSYPGVNTVFSFGPVKMITTAGMGGMICTDNEELLEDMDSLKSYGMSKSMYQRRDDPRSWYYDIPEMGHNYRMTDVAASMGIAQLERADQFIRRRRELGEYYTELLNDIEGLEPPPDPDGVERAYLYYPVKLNEDVFPMDRDDYALKLKDADLGVSVHWAKPLYKNGVFDHLDHEPGDFPVADRLSREVLSLPLHQQLDEEDLETIVSIMRDELET